MQLSMFEAEDQRSITPQRPAQSFRLAPTAGKTLKFRGWLVLEDDEYTCPRGGWFVHTVVREYATDAGGFVFEEEHFEVYADCSGEQFASRKVTPGA